MMEKALLEAIIAAVMEDLDGMAKNSGGAEAPTESPLGKEICCGTVTVLRGSKGEILGMAISQGGEHAEEDMPEQSADGPCTGCTSCGATEPCTKQPDVPVESLVESILHAVEKQTEMAHEDLLVATRSGNMYSQTRFEGKVSALMEVIKLIKGVL